MHVRTALTPGPELRDRAERRRLLRGGGPPGHHEQCCCHECACHIQLTFPLGAPSGPLSQSCALETFGTPHWCPFQPSKPSILRFQNPVLMSLMTMRPSAFRTWTPHAPPPNPLPSLRGQSQV